VSSIPDHITFISLPSALAQFHHLPEHVPLRTDRLEEAREKGYPFAEGVSAMEEVLQANPQVPGSYLFRLFIDKWSRWRDAEKLLASGRLTEAIQTLVGILEIDPDCPLTCFQLGFCFRATDELEKSESFYKKALTLAPDAGWIYSNLGRTYQAMGQTRAAAEVYWKALEKLPNDLFVLEQLEALGEIVGLPPDEKEPGVRSYMKRVDYEDKIRKTLESLSDAGEILKLGWTALQGCLWDVAVSCFERIRSDFSEVTKAEDAELGLGIALLHLGREEEAERWLRGYLDKNPDSAAGHLNLFKAYLLLQEDERAWEEIQAAAMLSPGNHEVLQQLFAFFEKTGRDEEGMEILKCLERENPKVAAPLLLQAKFQDEKGDWKKAEELLREALRREPEEETVLLYYSSALGRRERFEDVIRLLQARKEKPTFSLTVNLVLALRRMGRGAEAQTLLEEFKDRKDVPSLDRLRAEVLRQELGKNVP